MTVKKKLIEVALPLDAINKASAREKSIRHGHPSTLHLWWARRPLAACRAVLFASLVDDPSAHPDQFPTEEAQEAERQRLFRLIEELVQWENSNNERVLQAARTEILKSTDGHPPPVYDPFCGGGSIPLEAQRLGLEAHASDLNPVPVLITKALIEIPPQFAGKPPVNPKLRGHLGLSGSWQGAAGLAEDVRYYGQWMRNEAEKRIGYLYPKVTLPSEYGGGEATVIAWLWARTVASPNPGTQGAHVPLVRSFWLSTKTGKKAWVAPVVDQTTMTYRFEVRTGDGEPRPGTVSRNGGMCLLTGSPMPLSHIRAEGKAGRLGARLMAIVAEGPRGRIYLPPSEEHARIAQSAEPPENVPDTDMVMNSRYMTPTGYGMTKHRHLFTHRQLVALTTFCALVGEAREKVLKDSGGDQAYADAVATYLTLSIGKFAENASSLCSWHSGAQHQKIRATFGRHALSMAWDYAEGNAFSDSTGNFYRQVGLASKVFGLLPNNSNRVMITQLDATQVSERGFIFSTDPPYYDNVPYADLSDFFYVWLRQCLQPIYPELLGTVLVPKAEELVADPFRHGGKEEARAFFERAMGRVFERMRETSDRRFPTTIYYAFKQAEEEDNDSDAGEELHSLRTSTGWETFLQGLVDTGWQIDGTWPMRTELGNRMRNLGSNALASSIVLVCRPRSTEAPVATRRDFLTTLKNEMPLALRHLQQGNIAPVDLAQAAIGPGMAVYTRYARILDAGGKPLSVREALMLINQTLDEVLAEQEGDFDADSRWALAWFEQLGFAEGEFGMAETLSKAKNTSVGGMVEAGILTSRGGKVRLLRPDELPPDWDPATDQRLTAWEVVHHLIRVLEVGGESAAAGLVAKLGSHAGTARELAYRLYTLCERKKRAQEALSYNGLVQSWPEITRLSRASGTPTAEQRGLFE